MNNKPIDILLVEDTSSDAAIATWCLNRFNQKTRLSTVINRTDDLANMFDDLLDTSRLEAGLLENCREEHVLSDIVGQVERTLRTRAGAKRISLVASTFQQG